MCECVFAKIMYGGDMTFRCVPFSLIFSGSLSPNAPFI